VNTKQARLVYFSTEDTMSDSFFWQVATPFLKRENIVKGTMMGFPCLRIDGAFFASEDRDSGDLIVKLPASRVQELLNDAMGEPFAPAGRKFKEWVSIPKRDETLWKNLLAEALAFVGTV
jgi:hypothetical protein